MKNIDRSLLKMKKTYLFSFVMLSIIVVGLFSFLYDKLKYDHLENNTELYTKAYSTVHQQYLELSSVVFTGIVHLGDIKRNLQNLSSDTTKNQKIKHRIYNKIIPRYKQLKTKHIKNINIILPDGTIFLKMNNINAKVTKISDYRHLVKYVIKNKKMIHGYEKGVNGEGYRFVYPIMDNNKFIGIMSLTFGAEAITSALMKQYNILSNFFINEKNFHKLLLTKKAKLYQPSLHQGFILNMKVMKEIKKVANKSVEDIRPKPSVIKDMYNLLLEPNSSSICDRATYTVYTAIPIVHPITKDIEAKLTIRSTDKFFKLIRHSFFSTVFLTLLVIAFLLFIFYQQNSKNILLEEQKEEFESIFKYSKDGIAILDLETRFLAANQAYQEIIGYSLDELKEKTCIDLSASEYRQKSMEALQTALKTGVLENFEKVCIRKDGERVYINMTGTLLPDKKRFLVISKDITDLKHIEEQSRLVSMGEMIGNIAHQWRQPLSVISTASTGILMRMDSGILNNEIIEKEMNNINNNAQYLSKTIDDFRDFVKGDAEFSDIKVVDIINSTISIVGPSIKNNFIFLEEDINEELTINGNKSELEQAFINILNNSKDVIKEKEMEDGYISIRTEKTDDKSFKLIICDNGGGIPEEIMPKIFDPYFTTKHKSSGTGLGLSMVYTILRERHNLTIDVYNDTLVYNEKEYKGACFSINFKTSDNKG